MTNPIGTRNVLISNPSVGGRLPYLPYIWAVLKSYYERHGEGQAYRWLAPIFTSETDPLAPYRDCSVDVLGLSCYSWNWDLQNDIARRVKAENPDCLVVAGGPQPDYKDLDFFRKFPWIDVIVVNDGEIPFRRILEARLQGAKSYSSIRGLFVRDTFTGGPISTGPPEINTTFNYSPYLDQIELFEELTSNRPYAFQAVLETNRGCPYSCSFCDWGSNTMSKVRQFDIGRVRAEIEWLGRQSIDHMLLVDANFGILPRDPEIAELIDSVRKRYGSPRSLYYSPAKNNPERSLKIARTFALSGFVGVHCLAIQHTRPEVLAATDRENISAAKLKAVARSLQDEGIPIDVQLILGIPGDNYDLWKSCLTDLMEWGIHDQYIVYVYNFLPNAPVADPSFRERWQVGLSELYLPQFSGKLSRERISSLATSYIVTESATYSKLEWCRMNVFATLISAMHGRGVTRLVAIYLRHTHGISYRRFYEDLVEEFFVGASRPGRIAQALLNHYDAVLARTEVWDQLNLDELPGHADLLHAAQWVHAQVGLEFPEFSETLRQYLLAKYPKSEILGDLIAYQAHLLILPDYDCTQGKSFAVRFDWPEYFARARQCESDQALPEPAETPGAEVLISACTSGTNGDVSLDWHTMLGEERRLAWLDRVVSGRSCADRTNFCPPTVRQMPSFRSALH